MGLTNVASRCWAHAVGYTRVMSPSLYLVASQAQEVALRGGRGHGLLRGALVLVLLVVVVLVVVGVAIGVLVARRLGRRGSSSPGVDSSRWRQ